MCVHSRPTTGFYMTATPIPPSAQLQLANGNHVGLRGPPPCTLFSSFARRLVRLLVCTAPTTNKGCFSALPRNVKCRPPLPSFVLKPFRTLCSEGRGALDGCDTEYKLSKRHLHWHLRSHHKQTDSATSCADCQAQAALKPGRNCCEELQPCPEFAFAFAFASEFAFASACTDSMESKLLFPFLTKSTKPQRQLAGLQLN
jgi:hypothetical protein